MYERDSSAGFSVYRGVNCAAFAITSIIASNVPFYAISIICFINLLVAAASYSYLRHKSPVATAKFPDKLNAITKMYQQASLRGLPQPACMHRVAGHNQTGSFSLRSSENAGQTHKSWQLADADPASECELDKSAEQVASRNSFNKTSMNSGGLAHEHNHVDWESGTKRKRSSFRDEHENTGLEPLDDYALDHSNATEAKDHPTVLHSLQGREKQEWRSGSLMQSTILGKERSWEDQTMEMRPGSPEYASQIMISQV